MPGRVVLYALIILIFISPIPASASSDAPEDYSQSAALYLPYIKGLDASRLDPQLPKVPFKKWLADISGPGAVTSWDVNDCGEQPGFPEPGWDYPVCVEAEVSMPVSLRPASFTNWTSSLFALIQPVISG